MTALPHPNPREVPDEERRELVWHLRGLCHLALAKLEVGDVEAAARALRDAIESVEAAR